MFTKILRLQKYENNIGLPHLTQNIPPFTEHVPLATTFLCSTILFQLFSPTQTHSPSAYTTSKPKGTQPLTLPYSIIPTSRSTHSTSRAAPNADETSSSLWARFPIAPVALPSVAATVSHYAGHACSLPRSVSPSPWSRFPITLATPSHHAGRVHCSCHATVSSLLGPLHRRNLLAFLARLTPQRFEPEPLSLPNNPKARVLAETDPAAPIILAGISLPTDSILCSFIALSISPFDKKHYLCSKGPLS